MTEQNEVILKIKSIQADLQSKQKQLDQALTSNTSASAAADMNSDDLTELRKKTREVEEVGMKIDELLHMCQDNEALITRLGRFCDTTFTEGKYLQLSEADLKQRMAELNSELDKFPRKNRHSTEWYEKYAAKFAEL